MRSVRRLGVLLATGGLLATTMFVGVAGVSATIGNHGISVNKGCQSPTKIGDPYTCSYTIFNINPIDSVGDTLTFNSLVDTVNRAPTVSSGNILSQPGILGKMTFTDLGGGLPSCTGLSTATPVCTLPGSHTLGSGSSITITGFSFTDVTAADYAANPAHLLTDNVTVTWNDTCNGSGPPTNCPGPNQTATTGSSTEIEKLDSSTATQIHNAAHGVVTVVPAGTNVHDFVTVTGQPNKDTPTGNVNIDWFLNGDCTLPFQSNSGSVGPLDANGQFDATAFNFTVNNPGLRSFRAHYEGDGTYNPSDGLCEPLRVVDAYIDINPPVDTNPVTATHTFTASVFVNDGGGAGYVAAPNGTAVTFAYVGGHVGDFKPDVPAGTNPNPCLTVGGSCGIDTTSTSAGNDTMQASASLSVFGIPFSLTTGTAKPGHINSDNATKHWADDSVRTDIHDAAHNVITSAQDGTVIHDKVFVTRDPATDPTVPDPTGDVVFHRFATIGCTGASVDQTVTLAGGVAESGPFTVAGTDVSYMAHYVGDANYPAHDGACEPLHRLVPAVTIIKATNGADANDPNAAGVPVIPVGGAITWTFDITNTGQTHVAAADVHVTDNNGVTPDCTAAAAADANHIFDPGETWHCTATGTAINITLAPPAIHTVPNSCTQGGAVPPSTAYFNTGTVMIPGASANDPSSYCNPPVQLACPLPPQVFGLGAAANYSVLGLRGANLIISEGATNIKGNVGLGVNGTGSLLKAKIDGTLFLDPSAHPDIHGDLTVTKGVVIKSMAQETADALAANLALAAMAPTQPPIGNITSNTTISGGPGVNVISLAGVNMVKGTLTVSGSPSSIFIINVSGGFNFSSASMVLAGGVSANNIIWNFIGTGPDVNIFKPVTVAYGTFLAPYRNMLQDHATVTGRYIGALDGRTLKLHSAATLICPD